MESYKYVLPEHLNHYGFLFGGNLLKWVDEVSWIAASLEYPGCNFVTIGLDRVEFKQSVKQGSILRFAIDQVHEGNTSVRYAVNVFGKNLKQGDESHIFSTTITFVCVDEQGEKCSLCVKHGKGFPKREDA